MHPPTTSNTAANSTDVPPHQQRWNKTWNDFIKALNSPEPFNPFPWIYRLCYSAIDYGYFQSGLRSIVEYYQLRRRWSSLMPLLVMALILFMLLLYVISLRKLLRERWCQDKKNIICLAMPLQDFLSVYLTGMILYHYLKTNLTSPGVALSNNARNEIWSSMDNRGGFYGSRGHPKLDVDAEDRRVALYGTLTLKKNTTKENATIEDATSSQNPAVFPSPGPSYCSKCDIIRPPRCHHCRVCNRCVLQFDHHCIWVNNCIGYNNYRSFLALLLHIVLACWYGLCLLMVPFYELIRKEQARQDLEYQANDIDSGLTKLILAYQRSQFFDDVPNNPIQFFQAMRSEDGLPWTVAIKIAYPLLLGIGTVMAVFLGFHIKYVVAARTTLEHKIILEMLCKSLRESSFFAAPKTFRTEVTVNNPFDDGWRNNIRRIIGPKPCFLFLPWNVEVPVPFVPNKMISDGEKKTK